MATFCHWIYRRWSLSRITGLVLISNYKSQVTAPVSAASHRLLSWSSARVTSLPHKNLCGLKNLRSCSSGADSVPQKGGLIVTETSLLLNATCSHEKAEVSSPAKETFPTDLDVIPPPSPFEEISEEEAVQIEGREVLPPASFTLRDYIDQSDTLRRLVLLGVDLSKLEQRPNVANMLLRLDFDKNVKECLLFLKDLGVEEHQFGAFLTKNPFILTESLENLQKRVSYLQSKKFSKEAIARMVSRAPYLLNFSVERLDNKLAFYHKELGLNVQKTRELITRLPSLLTGSLESVKENLKVYRIEFGFQENELQHMVMKVPKMLVASKKKVTVVFDYLHNIMGIPHRLLTNFPQVFNTKLLRIKERHLFLEHLGRAQYDPVQPNYVSLDKLVATPDDVFCMEIAKATLPDFEAFQKTL